MATFSDEKIYKFLLPKKIKKRIEKTGEGRGGSGIYKRRNSRDYRVIIQYSIWKDLIKNEEGKNKLKQYEKGYAVYITPEEYFGKNYPKPSTDLEEKFELGKTGFIFYSTLDQYKEYKPLEKKWKNLYELSTTGKLKNDNTWTGDYAINVKNGKKSYKSLICGKDRKGEAAKKIQKEVKQKFNLDAPVKDIPKQCGLGNYDFDYANKETINNVKYQMLYLLITCKTKEGKTAPEFIYENYHNNPFDDNYIISHKDDGKTFQKYMEKPKQEYITDFNNALKEFQETCQQKNLLDYEKLEEKGIWDSKNSQLICPLCHKPIYFEQFFEDIKQMKGRQVADNTQKCIVLMHIDALCPGEFNHVEYNLGWGHNYCNLIQGDKNVAKTIFDLKEIIKNHENLNS